MSRVICHFFLSSHSHFKSLIGIGRTHRIKIAYNVTSGNVSYLSASDGTVFMPFLKTYTVSWYLMTHAVTQVSLGASLYDFTPARPVFFFARNYFAMGYFVRDRWRKYYFFAVGYFVREWRRKYSRRKSAHAIYLELQMTEEDTEMDAMIAETDLSQLSSANGWTCRVWPRIRSIWSNVSASKHCGFSESWWP